MNILEEIQNCPVEWKELGEVSHFYGGLTGKTKSDFENGNAKYVTYKNIFNNIQVELNILENVQVDENEKQNFIEYGDVLITGSSESKEEVGMSSVVTFVPEEPIYLNSFSFGIRFNEDVELLPEFTKYLFRSIEFRKQIEKTASGVTRYNISKVAFKKIKVPLLPQKIQEKIVQILDKMTDYVTELTSELTSRKKQYSFYRDKLLSFEDEVYQVEWKTLGELFVFKNGLNKGKEFFGSGTPIVNYTDVYRNNKISANVLRGKVRVSPEEKERYGVQRGDVFFTRTSETQEEIGKTSVLLDEVKDGVFSGFVLRARPITKLLLPEYCAYCFESTTFRRDIVRYSAYTTRALTNGSALSKLKIPVPSLEIQSRIVQVLDNFDKVCNDLNIGLPKEIELRQKQYEYFREKLLTFVAEGEYTESRVE
ncbi:putative type-1 restriction enzyme specificity protein [Streptococcus oralis]|uniref:Putative type-1 restriction enzyme specificity protein n=1 Tax=Streptococcus oralis TaxID=1303 RepID=A0A3R9LEV0_STROR|nr:restriction endonuclease subunit S [Streptococcus oralis]RSK09607.1 putative type-1 restriction enzyme specificity protein [Streptococcus oralis]